MLSTADVADRLRPRLPVAMGWRHVLFANRPVDPAVVSAHLPDGLAVDAYDGQAWLSVVPFTNVAVRPPWLPRQVGFSLPELNLRTYVTCDGEPGVYFFSLDADGILGVVGARLFHHLPYFYAGIDMSIGEGRIHFACRRRHPGARPARVETTYGPTGDRFFADEGSLARYLTERHRYYTEAADGSLRYATVEHDPWPLYEATATVERNTLYRANGFDEPASDPVYLYSPGVDTLASGSRKVSGR